jgi:hypothetical protein
MLARSPNRKAAVVYLAASGAAAITIIQRDGVCSVASHFSAMVNAANRSV